ncbi:MAG: hypothetical protein NZM44_00385, partial [Candidatus Calescibacterium sp.]|nr:hypothetical protein [Candidatus Calescibacterium sp.]
MYTLEHAFQKDAYVIINGFKEEQIRIPPLHSYWTAGNFVADAHTKYTNLPNNYTEYIPDIDCAIDKGLHLCSSESVNLLGQFYDFLKSRGYNGTTYPSDIPEEA